MECQEGHHQNVSACCECVSHQSKLRWLLWPSVCLPAPRPLTRLRVSQARSHLGHWQTTTPLRHGHHGLGLLCREALGWADQLRRDLGLMPLGLPAVDAGPGVTFSCPGTDMETVFAH